MEKVLIFGHKNPDTDSICSSMVREILDKKNGWNETKAVRLGKVNKETQYVLNYLGIEAPELIEEIDEGQQVILVDHNSFMQSVNGIEKAKILSVFDHHKISNFETAEPLYFIAKPYGCTATVLFEEFKQNGHTIDTKEAVLMASSIISDTLLLKSPTTTEHDKKALEELAKIANIDVNTYGLDMLKAGTDLGEFSIEEILNLDAKAFNFKEIKAVINQVNTASIEDVMTIKQDLEAGMQKIIDEQSLDLFLLLITDIVNSNSQAIVLGKRADLVEKAYNVKLENNTVLLKGVVSRKKQVIPVLTENA